MQREIKFRAWDADFEKMMPVHEAKFVNGRLIGAKGVGWDSEVVITQFTGLLDRNGKEIYEGDIIRHYLDDKPHSSKAKSCEVISEVVWWVHKVSDNEHNNKIIAEDPSAFNQEPCFTTREIKNEKGYGCCSWSHFAGCEVIGNIWENPNLLARSDQDKSE